MSDLVIAPAEIAVVWGGSKDGPQRITMNYWQNLMKELPADVRFSDGHPDTPHRIVDSAVAAEAVVDILLAFLKAKHANVKVKKQLATRIFRYGDDDMSLLHVLPVSHGDTASDARPDGAEAWTVQVDGATAVVWDPNFGTIRVRATSDEVLFIDGEPAKLDAALAAKPIAVGTITCKTALVAMWTRMAITSVKGLEAGTLEAVEKVVGHGLKAKSGTEGAVVVVPASGKFRLEAGSANELRWCRFTRV